jgi:hypothetical protein
VRGHGKEEWEMALNRCPDCGAKRAWSAAECRRCNSTRESAEAGGVKGLVGGGAAMATGFTLMSWPDRFFFLAVVGAFGFTGSMYRTHDEWAAWLVWSFIGGGLGLVLWVLRLMMALFLDTRASWAALLAAAAWCVWQYGERYLDWMQRHR